MSKSKIEWCDRVWNPITGCTRVSPGCDNCYALRQSHRFSEVPGKFSGTTVMTDERIDWSGKVRCHEDLLDMPRLWTKPSRVFVNSMSDLFHDDVPEEFIAKMWYRMAVTDKHVYMILTKRPLKMKVILNSELFKLRLSQANIDFPLKNVWLGVSCENQAMADQRIPHLLKTPAAVRFVSYEPALGAIDFEDVDSDGASRLDALRGFAHIDGRNEPFPTKKIDWIICGGESGPGARPLHPAWARSVRDQCKAADVPFFFKQHGEYVEREWVSDDPDPSGRLAFAYPNGTATANWEPGPWNKGAVRLLRVGKKAAGRLLDGVEHSEFPDNIEAKA